MTPVDPRATVQWSNAAWRRLLQHRLRGAALPWQYIVVPLFVLLVWEIAADNGFVDAGLIPAPHTVVRTWWIWIVGGAAQSGSLYDGSWLANAWASVSRVLLGFAIAGAAGITIGISIGWFRLPRLLLQPLVDTIRPIPITAWIPFTVVFFGIGGASSIMLIALGAFFPIALNSAAGAQGTPEVLVSAARMLGTSKHRLVWRVVLPAALPSIVTGLRVGLALAWMLVIVAEMVAVKSGLGFSLWEAYYFTRPDVIVAAMFSVGILGFVSDKLLLFCTNRLMKWTPDVH